MTDNIALNKPTEQSGTFQKEDGTRYGSEKANNGDLSDFSLSLRGINSWWLVDLQSQHYVMGILIHNMRTMENPDGADSLMQWTGEGRNCRLTCVTKILKLMCSLFCQAVHEKTDTCTTLILIISAGLWRCRC